MRVIIAFVYIFLLIGCSSEPGINTIYNIPAEFEISINQTLSPQGPEPVFEINTVTTMGCEKDEINIDYQLLNGTFKLHIKDIRRDQACLSGNIELKSVIEKYFPFGRYKLDVILKELAQSSGNLFVQLDAFSIAMDELNGINIGRSRVLRIPDDLVWGQLTFDDEDTGLAFHELMQTFADSIQLIPGDYGLFTVSDGGNIISTNISIQNSLNYSYSIKNWNGSYAEKVATFINEHANATLSLYTSTGKVF